MSQRTAYLKLHVSVFLFGFTAILGALITLGSSVLVWYRLLITVAAYGLWLWARGQFRRVSWAELRYMGLVGIVLGLHWITFYGSIKLASATVALVCLSCAAFFSAIVEPLLYRTPFERRNLLLSILVIAGIYLVFHFQPAGHEWGIVVGLVSALLSALVGILNKRIVGRYDDSLVNFYELVICLGVFTLAAPVFVYFFPQERLAPTTPDWIYLMVLSLVCTNFAYNWSLSALRSISVFNFILAINLEPLYGIALAYFILGENRDVNAGFVVGVLLVLSAVFFNVLLQMGYRLQNRLRA